MKSESSTSENTEAVGGNDDHDRKTNEDWVLENWQLQQNVTNIG